MENISDVFSHWRSSLLRFHDWFEGIRASTRNFRLKTFMFFVVLNLGCYWWALLTTYPQFLTGPKADEYVLMGFPVAVLGALFPDRPVFGQHLSRHGQKAFSLRISNSTISSRISSKDRVNPQEGKWDFSLERSEM